MAVHNLPDMTLRRQWSERCHERLSLRILDAQLVLRGNGDLIERVAPLFAGLEGDPDSPADEILAIERPECVRRYGVMNPQGCHAEAERWEQVLPFLLSMVFSQLWDRCDNMLPLHSACVAWEGQGILFPAVSGGGKTTLALELARSGFVYFSDEFAPLNMDTGQVGAVARPAQASERTIRALMGNEVEAILSKPALRDDDGSLRYMVLPLRRAARTDTVPARVIMALELDPAATEPAITAWPKADAFAALAACALVYHRGAAWQIRGIQTLLAATTHARCYKLHLGPIGSHADLIHSLLSDEAMRRSIDPSPEQLSIEIETVQAIAQRACKLVEEREG